MPSRVPAVRILTEKTLLKVEGSAIEVRRPRAIDNPKALADFTRVVEQTGFLKPDPPEPA